MNFMQNTMNTSKNFDNPSCIAEHLSSGSEVGFIETTCEIKSYKYLYKASGTQK